MAFPEDNLGLYFEAFLDGGWVDLTGRLLSQTLSLTRGRADEHSQASPASLTAILDNVDGWLTPTDPRSPWWPQVDLGLRIRVRVDATTELLGEVSVLLPLWPNGDLPDEAGWAQVTITVSGILRRLSQGAKPLRSTMVRHVTSPGNLPHVFDYFPMEDGSTATQIASGIPGRTRGTMAFTGLSMAGDSTLEGSAPLPTASSGPASWLARHLTGFNAQGVIEVFCRFPDRPTDTGCIFRPIDIRTTGGLARWVVELRFFGVDPILRVRTFNSFGVETNVTTAFLDASVVFFQPAPIQLRLELNDSGGSVAWSLSWWTVTHGTDPGEFMTGTFTGSFGTVTSIGGLIVSAPTCMVGHTILHDGIPAGWLVGPDVGWWGETDLVRVPRLCGEEGISVDMVLSADTRGVPMGAQRPLKLLDLLQECAAASASLLGEQRFDFGLRYLQGRARYNRAPAITLDGSLGQIGDPFAPTRDDQSLRNDVTGQRPQGSSARAVDQASIDARGLYDDSETWNVAMDARLRHLAGWSLHLGTVDGLRYPQITIELHKVPELIPVFKTIHEGDIIRLENLPPQHPLGNVDLVIEGFQPENLSPDAWTVTLLCTPAAPWIVGKWGVSKWGSRDSTLADPVASSDGTLFVATPGKLWTTDPAQFPFDIMLGPERLTATAITGASTPQVWSVIRNVNGFARSHDVGTPVVLAEPAVIGL